MLLILFGPPGVGKSFIGKLIEDNFGLNFYDADIDLTPELIHAIKNKQTFTQKMRDDYYAIILNKIDVRYKIHKKVITAQAFAKEKNREELLERFPNAKFIFVKADPLRINERLKKRNDWVTLDYAGKIRKIFEEPNIDHIIIDNNRDKEHLINQFNLLFTEVDVV